MSDPTEYAHPEALVSTEWLASHLNDPGQRIVESNEDVLLYDTGHIPGAVHIDWREDLQDATVRDYIDPKAFAALCEKNGIGPDNVVFKSAARQQHPIFRLGTRLSRPVAD